MDPEEAGQLLELIEALFDEWFIASHAGQTPMKSILALADKKNGEKSGSPSAP